MNDLPVNAAEIYALRTEQVIASADEIGTGVHDCQAEVAPGESVQFQFAVFLSGMSTGEVKFTVMTPGNPNGGFMISGTNEANKFKQITYGGDDFNTATTQAWRGGVPGTLEGYDTHIIAGNLANSPLGGLLKLKITEASNVHVMPGTNLQVWRIGNSRANEVGA